MESLKDVDGKESSKRKYGARLLNISLAMAILYFVAGIGKAFVDQKLNYDFPLEIWWTLIGTGTSLLGITLFERFSKKN